MDQQLMTSVYATKLTACELCVTTVPGDIKIDHITKRQKPFTNCIQNTSCHNFKVVYHELSILWVINEKKNLTSSFYSSKLNTARYSVEMHRTCII